MCRREQDTPGGWCVGPSVIFNDQKLTGKGKQKMRRPRGRISQGGQGAWRRGLYILGFGVGSDFIGRVSSSLIMPLKCCLSLSSVGVFMLSALRRLPQSFCTCHSTLACLCAIQFPSARVSQRHHSLTSSACKLLNSSLAYDLDLKPLQLILKLVTPSPVHCLQESAGFLYFFYLFLFPVL